MAAKDDPYAGFEEVTTPRAPTRQQRKMDIEANKDVVSTDNTAAQTETENQIRPYKVRKARADAAQAEIEAAAGPKITDAQLRKEQDKEGKEKRANTIRMLMKPLREMYEQDIKGQPIERLGGAAEYIPLIPANERFRDAGKQILPLIRPLVAQSAREGDSNTEMTIFESYIPSNTNADISIEQKFKALDTLIDGMLDGKPPSQTLMEKPEVFDPRVIAGEMSAPDTSDVTGRVSPLTPTEPEYEDAKTGDLAVSKTDREKNAELQALFDSGASLKDLKAKAGELGLTIKNNLLEGVRYRDKFLREGGKGPSGVVFEPTARPMTLEERRNAAGRESALNAFLANTGNALSLGTAPAIEGLFDPNGAQTTRESLSAMRENSPWASMAGDVAGSIAPSGLAAKGLMATGRFTLPRAAGLADILTGTAQGAFENPEHPVAGGTLGGGSAALGALAGKYLINPVAQEGMDRIVSSRAPKPTFGEKTVAKQLGDPDEVVTALTDAERLGLPMGLADTTPEGQALARLSAQLSPKAADTADRFYPTRQAGRNERAAEAIERDVAPSVDLEARRQATRAEAQVAASPWYDRAYSQPAPIEDSVLKEVLSGRDARLAVSKAYDIAKNEGRDPTELGFVLNKKGEPELARGLTWESLDYVRQGISGLLEPKRNPLTGKLNLEKDPVARSQTTLLTRLTSRMDDLNPDYAAARAVYEEAVTPNNYLRRGIAAADAKVKPSEVERMLADVEALPPERQGAALENLRAGYATTLRDRALNRTETADGYTTAYGSKYQQEKMALLGISPEDFARQAELERKMAVTARDTTQGVKAEARDAAKKAMTPSDMAQIATETFLSGAPAITGANALMRLAAYNRGAWKYVGKGGQERQTRDAAKLADSLAPLLMGDDPSAALAILRASQGAVDRRAAAEMPVQAASIYGGGLLGKSGGLSLLNSGDYPSSDPYALAPSIPETEEQKRNRELFERYGMLPADMPL